MSKKSLEKTSLRVLYLEDSPKDVEIIRELLAEAGFDLNMDCAEKKKEFTSLLYSHTYDVILSDFSLPGFDAFDALKLVLEICPEVPFICISGSIGEETAIELIRQGAVDYVLKDRMVRLPLAIQRALGEFKEKKSRQQAEEALKKTEARFRSYFELSIAGIAITSSNADWVEVNDHLCEMLGYSREELRQKTWSELTQPEDLDIDLKHFKRVHAGEIEGYSIDKRFICKNGNIIWTSLSVRCVRLANGEVDYFVALIFDISDRKKSEDKIRENEEKYHSIFENSNIGILLTIPDGTILSANDYACKLFGMTEEELCRQGRDKIVDKTDPRLPMSLDERHRTGRVKTELTFIRKNGTKFEGEVSSVVFIDSGGKEKTSMIIQDLTERKRVQEELRKGEEKYRSIFENVQDVYYEASIDGTILEVSPSIETISKGQYHRDDLIGKSMYDFYAIAGGRETLLTLLQERGYVTDHEVMLKNRDSSNVPCSITAKIQFAEQGKILKIIGSMHDITERKRAEEALLENEAKYRTLVTQSPDGIFIVDLSGAFLSVNKAMCDNLMYSEEELLSMKMWDIVPQKYLSLHKSRLAAIIKGESKKDAAEYEVKGKDGIVHFVEILSAPYYKDKEIIGFQGIARDITERKQMEEHLRQMQKLEGLGTLAGGIAHDFNNILGIILAYITTTKRFQDEPKKLDLAVDTIVKAVERGKTLVQQILTFARKSESAFGVVKVNDVIMEIMVMIFETFPKVLKYAQNFDKAVTYINADRSQLHQVLLNLCVNARDAMPNGGVLTINTRMVPSVSLLNQYPNAIASSYICIEVSDTGEGMTEETQKHIFEPFFTTKGIGKGTGLGLSVVFGVIQTHKGFIDVESKPGKGTTFRLYLPAEQVTEPTSEKEEKTLEEMPGGIETLLIIEDEEVLLMSLRMMLIEKGYKVLYAQDGLKALEIFQERKNDIELVVTDLGLPNITGREVCQRIKQIKPHEKIILATGFLDPEMKSEFLNEGIENFLYKPYDLKEVLKMIREVLEKK